MESRKFSDLISPCSSQVPVLPQALGADSLLATALQRFPVSATMKEASLNAGASMQLLCFMGVEGQDGGWMEPCWLGHA